MNHHRFCKLIQALGAVALAAFAPSTQARPPNLLIIQTDEHSFRTLGCYRELMPIAQGFPWGAGQNVTTPNIDRIAHEGAICTSYYASSPVCSPSRASLMTGLYPIAAGVQQNGRPLRDDVITFAQVLKQQGYATSYVGKWHLMGGDEHYVRPTKKFGFDDNTHMVNGGHFPWLKVVPGGLKGLWEKQYDELARSKGGLKDVYYVTDYLTDRALDILKRDQHKPFCLMLSIPDPHSPDVAREPYISMFSSMALHQPRTMDVPVAQRPKWGTGNDKNQAPTFEPDKMRGYFGMVKCIDDNVGRLLDFLKTNALERDTIVVFTADHGDMLYEHNRVNKGVPYEASARIPFVIRYPARIEPGKVVRKSYTTVDFAPTILGLMDAPPIPTCQGLNDAAALLSRGKEVGGGRVVYVSNSASAWVAATDGRHKLVLSVDDQPWLFDLQQDPDELVNVYADPRYAVVAMDLQAELMRQMQTFQEPALKKGKLKFDPRAR